MAGLFDHQDRDCDDMDLEKSDVLTFRHNGKVRTVCTKTIDADVTLNDYLRDESHHKGTKYMCNEGGCGSCIVAAIIHNPRTNAKEIIAVNSCLVALLSCQNWEIITIEQLGNQYDGLHEIQQRIVQFNATQCGFCTPGMVMNMYALQQADKTQMAEIENSFGGNMCRCTGYRSILTAFKSMASDVDVEWLGAVPDLPDIEELTICSRRQHCDDANGDGCLPALKMPMELRVRGGGVPATRNWYKVQTIPEIFSLFRKNGARSYQLVAGNTARGVYKDIGQRDYYVDISDVAELKRYELNTSCLKLGANMSLNDVMNVCVDIIERDDDFEYLSKFVEHLDLVATVPVRNIGTLAGNLSLKHEHNEFASDIFLLLETIGAKLIIDYGHGRRSLSPREYLSYSMEGKIIHSVELPPLDASYKLETYKIMPRAQNAHAYVNAGFLLRTDPKTNVVSAASFVFGGISSYFVHAQGTEALIRGKSLFDNGIMQKMFAKLSAELNTVDRAPDPSPDYRRKLAVSLMYKFILSIAPDGVLSAANKSGGAKLKRPPVSTGIQDYKTKESLYPIGEPISKLEARIQASGEAEYVMDKPDLPRQCFAAFVLGKAAAGSILDAIDASDALSLDGVEGFFQASDIEGINSFIAPNAFNNEEEEIFLPLGEPIKFYYQPVGAIVARSRRLAEYAAERVKVTFEPATTVPVLTVKDALATDTQRVHHLETRVARKQDLDAAVKFHGAFEADWKFHYYMEQQVVGVVPGDDGYFDIYPATQWMDHVQSGIERSLNIPAHKLRISVKRLGGGFGGKATRNNWTTIVATLAAQKLRKPVKFLIPFDVNMNIMGKRNSYRSEYEVGVDQNGIIGYLNNHMYSNVGCYQNAMWEWYQLDLYEGTYVNNAFQTDTYWVRTDTPAATMMRAPGSFEGCAMIETVLEHIAYKVDRDPIDVRLANLNVELNPLLARFIDECLQWSEYRKRRADIEAFNKANRWRKKGISLIPMAFRTQFGQPYNVQVSIFQADGTVAISHGGVELGQGINTKTVQAAAHLLGIDMSQIEIWPTNNFTAVNGYITGSSATTEGVIRALHIAAGNLLKRINAAAAAKRLSANASWLDRVRAAFDAGQSLTENAHFSGDIEDPVVSKIYGVCVSEVEVDILTGTHLITRVDLLEDAGDSLNPAIDVGQCEGAFVMGMGHWTIENIVFDEEGALLTNSTWTYKIPGAKDIPIDFRVKLPDGVPDPATPLRNKATSEPPICLSFSVPLAIKHALKSARLQANPRADSWAAMERPATIDWVFTSALPDFRQYKL